MSERNVGPVLLSVENLSKSFTGTKALSGVAFSLRPGEILALLGHNGSGKSTLVKVLAGPHRPDDGVVHVDCGIDFIHQDLGLVPSLSTVENLALGGERRWRDLLPLRRDEIASARAAIARFGGTFDVTAPIANHSSGTHYRRDRSGDVELDGGSKRPRARLAGRRRRCTATRPSDSGRSSGISRPTAWASSTSLNHLPEVVSTSRTARWCCATGWRSPHLPHGEDSTKRASFVLISGEGSHVAAHRRYEHRDLRGIASERQRPCREPDRGSRPRRPGGRYSGASQASDRVAKSCSQQSSVCDLRTSSLSRSTGGE